jgi:hypothetical protein
MSVLQNFKNETCSKVEIKYYEIFSLKIIISFLCSTDFPICLPAASQALSPSSTSIDKPLQTGLGFLLQELLRE